MENQSAVDPAANAAAEPQGSQEVQAQESQTENNVSDAAANQQERVKVEESPDTVQDMQTGDADDAQGTPAPDASASADQSRLNAPTPPVDPQVKQSTPSAQQPTIPTGPAAMSVTPPTGPASQSVAPKVKLSDLPVDARRQLLEDRVKQEPRDGEAWLALIEEAQSRENMDDTRRLYDQFFDIFPNQGRQWIAYADLELAHSNFAQVEAIFTRCLRSTPSVDLWKFYLSYTRRVNPLPPPSGADEDGPREQARRTLEGAYEFALKYIGMDKDSGSIWMDYIALIKEREAHGGWKEGQKMDDLRRVYQRAVSVPLTNIEAIWKDYDAYENGLNKLTAKKFLAERSPAYMSARRVLRDLKGYTDNLARPLLPRIPPWTSAAVSGEAGDDAAQWEKERAQVEGWKQYLKWEESNPLLLEDLTALQARVTAGYRKATMFLRFYPEIWYSSSLYLTSVGRQDEAAAWLKNGIQACPGSFLLPFAYVELAEARKSTSDCAPIFDSLLDQIHAKIEARKLELEQALKSIDTEAEVARAQAAAKRVDEGDGDVDIDGEERELERKVDEERQARKAQCEDDARPQIEGLKEAAALVWIKYMHFLRRTEGIRPTRTVFSRARKSPHCTWQVYEASALMEYHCSKDAGVATKVFELALKTYGTDEAFVVRYLDFLISINDDNNARALFERTIGTFTPERARPIWDRWSEYEYSFGDTAAIQKLESRLAETYPEEPPIKRFVDRNSYMDLDMIGPRDLGFQAAISGASAADRAVAATKETEEQADAAPKRRTMEEMKRLAAESNPDDRAGGWAKKEGVSAPPAKRARHGRDSESPAPPTGPRKAMPAAMQGPPIPTGPAASRQGPVPPVPQAIAPELPEAVMLFMNILPSAKFFDGPTFKAEDLMDCLRHANVPGAPPQGPAFGGGMGRGGFGGAGPGAGGFTGRKPPFARGRGRPGRGRMY